MYIVFEIQTSNGQVATLVNSYDDKLVAESNYYRVLSAAAVSTVPVHAVVMLSSTGQELMSAYYAHD